MSRTADAFVFETNHHNSSQGYQVFTVLFVRRERIDQIEDVMLLSCSYCESGAFRESAGITTLPDAGRAMNQIVFRVVLELLPDPEDIERPRRTRASRQIFLAKYHWDAVQQKYAAASKALETVEAFNEKNY